MTPFHDHAQQLQLSGIGSALQLLLLLAGHPVLVIPVPDVLLFHHMLNNTHAFAVSAPVSCCLGSAPPSAPCAQHTPANHTSFLQVGYHVTVRTAIGGGPSCFRNLRHEFLTVLSNEGDFKDSTLIVDPLFREQFAIPQPTATYEALLELIPQEFVGTASRLIPLVQCLCAEMVASFESKGLTLPPWRRAQSMLSKWLPTKSRDVAFGGSSSAGSLSRCSSGSAAAAGVAGTSCESDSGSLELSAAGGSPFSKDSDVDVAERVVRQSSSRSLLSGKLSVNGAARNSSTNGSRLGVATAGSTASQAVGTVSMQPPVYRGQPPTYKVKIASAAALLQQLPRRQ